LCSVRWSSPGKTKGPAYTLPTADIENDIKFVKQKYQQLQEQSNDMHNTLYRHKLQLNNLNHELEEKER
jgi:hypothetical protein